MESQKSKWFSIKLTELGNSDQDSTSANSSPEKGISVAEQWRLKQNFPVGDEYQLLKEVGKGSYGEVVHGRHLPTGKEVAIKKIFDIFLDAHDAKRLLREVLLLRRLDGHRNLIRLYDLILTEDPQNFSTLFLVFEYTASDLRKVYRSNV